MRVARFALVWILGIVFAQNAVSANPGVIAIPSLDPSATPSELFRKLDEDLKGKRIVFLGEASHWVHEKYDFRILLLNYLVANGFNHIGMEMGVSDGERVNRYLQTGAESDLERVALYGYTSQYFREQGLPATPFKKAFVSEEKNFYRNLRSIALNKGVRVRHFGFDLDMIIGGGFEDAKEQLSPFSKDPTVKGLLFKLDSIALASQSLPVVAKQLSALTKEIQDQRIKLSAMIGEATVKSVLNAFEMITSSIRFKTALSGAPPLETTFKEMAIREEQMFKQVDRLKRSLGPTDKVVFMGHNFHLNRDSPSLSFAPVAVAETMNVKMWDSVGEYIRESFPSEVFGVWMIHNQGQQSGSQCAPSCAVDTGSGYAGEILSGVGSPIFYGKIADMPHIQLNRPLNIAVNDNGTNSGNVAKNAEAVFFVDHVTPLREQEHANEK